MFIKNWYEKGVRTIVGLLNYNGDFYAFDEFKGMFSVQGTVLNFQSVISKIPNEWKIKMNNCKNECRSLKYNVACNTYVSTLIKDKRGCITIYEILIRYENSVPERWNRELCAISLAEWKKNIITCYTI